MSRPPLTPSRGLILDHQTGKVLATNGDNFRLMLPPEQTRKVDVVLGRASQIVPVSANEHQHRRGSAA